MEWVLLLQATLILFAVVNPVGSLPIFLQLTNKMTRAERRKTFQTAVVTAGVILFLFIAAGEGILTYLFQIQLPDLMAAGGLLLLIIAIDHLIFGGLVRSVLDPERQDPRHIGAVPMACPILAGPGAMMTVLVTCSGQGMLIAAASAVIVLTMTWVLLYFIDPIYKFLGEIVCLALSKILCLFLAAIGVRLLMTGVTFYFK